MTRKCLALFLTLLMLFAASGAVAQQADRGTVRIVLCEDSPTVDYVENVFPAFTERTGIKVEADILPGSSFYEKMVLGMTSGVQEWDICQVDVSCVGTLLEGDFLMPVDELIAGASNEWLSGYEGSEVLSNNFRYQDRIYAIPQFMGAAILMYNAQHFIDAGLDPDNPPRTLDELIEACKALNKPEEGRSAIVFRASREQATCSFFWSMLYFNQGGSWYPNDHQSLAIFDTEAAKKATEYFVELGKYAPEGILNYTYDLCYANIQQGTASMLLDMSHCATWTIDPELSTVYEDMRFSALDGHTLAGNWSFALGASCENPDLAWELIECITGKDVAWSQTESLKLSAPCRVDILDDPRLEQVYPPSLIQAMLDSQQDCDPMFYPMGAQCDEIVTDLAINLNDALAGTLTPEQAMEKTQAQVLAIKEREGLQ